MNIVLLNPPNVDKESYIARSADRWPHCVKRGKLFSTKMFPKYPLYMMYAAAVLEKGGFNVVVIDAAERNYSVEETKNIVSKIKPKLIITEISAPSRVTDLNAVKVLKEATGAHTALVGPHATVFSAELITDYSYVDSIARGEYYYTILDLASAIKTKNNFDKIEGVTYRKNKGVRENPDRPLIKNIDKLAFPARHLLDVKRYLMGHFTYKPQLLMVTSMGCPYKCIFCLWPKILYQGKVRFRKSEKVVEEMELLVEKYGAREIYFDDDCFNITERRVRGVCDAIIKRGLKIPWITEMRCDQVSQEMLNLMKKAGCIKILYGVESGSQRILDNAKKDITIEQIRKACVWTKKAGIKTHATFMFGLPGETRDTVEQTIRFAKELNPDTIQCSLALPYPGTDFYEIVMKKGYLNVNNWLDFDGELCGVVDYPELSKEYLRSLVPRMYKEFYVRPTYIVKRILNTRSIADIERFIDLGKGYFRRFSKPRS